MPPRDGGRGSRRTATAEVEGRRRVSDGAKSDEGNGDASDAAATRVANLCLAFGRRIRHLLPGTHGDDDDDDGV
jgi:hypothetical protein